MQLKKGLPVVIDLFFLSIISSLYWVITNLSRLCVFSIFVTTFCLSDFYEIICHTLLFEGFYIWILESEYCQQMESTRNPFSFPLLYQKVINNTTWLPCWGTCVLYHCSKESLFESFHLLWHSKGHQSSPVGHLCFAFPLSLCSVIIGTTLPVMLLV